MKALLVQQGLHKTLLGKSKKLADMQDSVFEDLDVKALSSIQLCLADDVLREVGEENTTAGIWLKLESIYMTKSLTNRLYLCFWLLLAISPSHTTLCFWLLLSLYYCNTHSPPLSSSNIWKLTVSKYTVVACSSSADNVLKEPLHVSSIAPDPIVFVQNLQFLIENAKYLIYETLVTV